MKHDCAVTYLDMKREAGKGLLFSPDSTREEKDRGISYLVSACERGDPESQYIIGKMLLEGTIALKAGDSRSKAIDLLCRAMAGGYYPARTLLNMDCLKRYNRAFPTGEEKGHPLTDFEGKQIQINHTGKLVPVDAVLEYTEEGGNQLTFSLNLKIIDDDIKVADARELKKAIIRGIRMWEGEYTVFGGQRLKVKINITDEPRLYDNVTVILMAGEMLRYIKKAMSLRHSEKALHAMRAIDDKRSMATSGIKRWSVRARKMILLHSETDLFDDYDEITHVIKHEFGHVLGLGDLYEEAEAGLQGVPVGYYSELDSFILKDKIYNLVMCDHHGIISNNDIEMVVLAFSENQLQQYQPSSRMKKISKALGRGN